MTKQEAHAFALGSVAKCSAVLRRMAEHASGASPGVAASLRASSDTLLGLTIFASLPPSSRGDMDMEPARSHVYGLRDLAVSARMEADSAPNVTDRDAAVNAAEWMEHAAEMIDTLYRSLTGRPPLPDVAAAARAIEDDARKG